MHLDVVQVLNNLGEISKRLGDTDNALTYYQEALSIRENLHGTYTKMSLRVFT